MWLFACAPSSIASKWQLADAEMRAPLNRAALLNCGARFIATEMLACARDKTQLLQTTESDLPVAERIKEIVASIDTSPIPTIVTDNRNDNVIMAANDAFLELTGYSSREVIGRNCRFLEGKRSEPNAKALVRNAVAAGRPRVVELWNYRKDGTSFRNAVMVAPIRDDTGETVFFIETQMAIHERSSPGVNRNDSRRLARGLTPKQRQLLKLIVNGLRDNEIAEVLGIGKSAVKRLRGRLLEKLEARTLADAIRIGIQAGLTG